MQPTVDGSVTLGEAIALMTVVAGALGAWIKIVVSGMTRTVEKTNDRIDVVSERQASILATLQSVTARLDHMNIRTDRLDDRINSIVRRERERNGEH